MSNCSAVTLSEPCCARAQNERSLEDAGVEEMMTYLRDEIDLHTVIRQLKRLYVFIFFRNLLSALVYFTTCEECDPLRVKSMFRMC